MIHKMSYDSPLGTLLIAEKEGALVGLWMEGQKYFLGSVKEEMQEKTDVKVLLQTREWLERYFKRERPAISELPLAPMGSEFQKAVWKILCQIPYGEVTTYKAIAVRIAKERGIERMSAQAVGGAVAHNPISIVIPCHRVVGSDGSLTGYAGGLDIKKHLLSLEGADVSRLQLN